MCREDVCAQLEGALTACASGAAGVVLLEGAVGCGKTEMLLHVAERAERRGALVLRAAGSAQERDVPHGVLRQLTAQLPAGTLPDGAAGQDPLGGREFTGALRAAAARTPVVVCVDDLHHTDPASLDRLLDVARAVRGERLLLVLADAPHEHAESPLARTEFLRHPGFTRILLGRLDEPGTAALLEDHTGRPAADADTAWLHGATGGNPLLLRALLSERPRAVRGPADRWPEPAPGGPFTQAALTCLHRDGADSRTLAVALAVLGEDATPELTARLAGAGPTAAARAVALLAPVRPQARIDSALADTAETLLRSWLQAAALDGLPFKQLARWAQGTAAQDPVRILRTHPQAAPGSAGELESALTAHPERREQAQQLTTRTLSCLTSIHIREACKPNRTDSLTLASFAAEGGTLYVLGEPLEEPRTHPGAMPLLTALAADVVEHGRRMAARSSHGRLDPPLTLVLEDVAAVAPVPRLPELLEDDALPLLALCRSREQARSRWPDWPADAR
ncbi:ATP-binding protein [Streptomyces sp. WAC07061]|uniref:ATP-binding protein n=1 Tax=Streptomyces sp. WAC07061 TaxID=2487410 RepID=UPI00163BC199|nr:ATP-binding protein [Streptomyces sp. WAC07061]